MLLLIVLGQLEAWTTDPEGSPRVVLVLVALVAPAALLISTRWPVPSAAVVLAALVVKDAFRGPGEVLVLLLSGVLAAFQVGLRLDARRARAGLGVVLALAALAVVVGEEQAPSELVFSAIAMGTPWGAGRLVRSSREHAAVVEELAAVKQREAAEAARRAASEERSRIARELHDLVGHSVSLMLIQAGGAAQVLRRDPDEAAGALAALQETGRAAVYDLHRVLGLLRADGDTDEVAPLPGIGELEALVDRSCRAGMRVELEVDGNRSAQSPGIGLAAFRIVQEALTNVLRHAPGALAVVRVECRPDRVIVDVLDDGPGPSGAPAGHGLLGMRERASVYGGSFTSGPGPAGGFRVRAELPVEVEH